MKRFTSTRKMNGDISLWAWAMAEILAMVCGQVGTYRFLMLFLDLLNPQLCKYVDSTEIMSVR